MASDQEQRAGREAIRDAVESGSMSIEEAAAAMGADAEYGWATCFAAALLGQDLPSAPADDAAWDVDEAADGW